MVGGVVLRGGAIAHRSAREGCLRSGDVADGPFWCLATGNDF